MEHIEKWLILGIFISFAVAEAVRSSFFNKARQTRDDGVVELASTSLLILVTQPATLFCSGYIASVLWPDAAGRLSDLPLIAGVALFLVLDDLTQYWWHRLSHTLPWLYKLHRPHHNAEYLSVRVMYRNNIFYYAMMPGLWFSGVLVYLGLGWVYVGYIVVKMAVISGAHSDVRWDQPLYRVKWLAPVMWIIERLISTPATHSAHHGKFAEDGITHYKGNYGNLLFLWDIIFGTAKITRQYPERFGVENLPATSAMEQLAWPLVRVKPAENSAHSHLSP